jgi:TolA-binding protein
MRVFISPIILTVSFALLLLDCSSSPTKKAKDFIDAGMYSEAASLLRERIADKPKDAYAHYLLGTVLLMVGEDSDAKGSFERATRLDQRYKEKAIDAYYDCGSQLVNQVSSSAIRRGLHYLQAAVAGNKDLSRQAARLCRDRGIALSSTDPNSSREVLREALRNNRDLDGDEEFYYVYYILDADGAEARSQACEEYAGRFPSGPHLADVYFELGDYQYNLADFKLSRYYFVLAQEKASIGDLAAEAQSRINDIDDIVASRLQSENERIRAIKQAEIERNKEIARIESEKAEKLKQIEIEKAQELQRLETQQAQLAKQQQLADQKRQVEYAEAKQMLLNPA